MEPNPTPSTVVPRMEPSPSLAAPLPSRLPPPHPHLHHRSAQRPRRVPRGSRARRAPPRRSRVVCAVASTEPPRLWVRRWRERPGSGQPPSRRLKCASESRRADRWIDGLRESESVRDVGFRVGRAQHMSVWCSLDVQWRVAGCDARRDARAGHPTNALPPRRWAQHRSAPQAVCSSLPRARARLISCSHSSTCHGGGGGRG